MKVLVIALAFIVTITADGFAQSRKAFELRSPDGKIVVNVTAGETMSWAVRHEQTQVLLPSLISMRLAGGEQLGKDVRVVTAKRNTVNARFQTPVYKKKEVIDHYNELVLKLKGNYGLVFRAYNDGVAYRFQLDRPAKVTIADEQAEFNLPGDQHAFIPYVRDLRNPVDQFVTSFEALYDEAPLSKRQKDSLAFLPLLISLDDHKKVVILEADVEDYPGMHVGINEQKTNSIKGVFAPVALEEKTGGYNNINLIVTRRADHIAVVNGSRSLPWRAIIISIEDKQLANNDMVQKLSSPTRIQDVSWIKPGKVAWDWWNDWNISHVGFKAGINTETYKHYIDFAAENKLEYIIMDEGWSESGNLMKVSPVIDLQEIIRYGKEKNVDVILWATWYALIRQMDEIFGKYGGMGVKGFKVDFFDRDDQKVVASTYEIASKAADHKLLIDFHGIYKPTGLQRVYPNIINFEGVKGLENNKWTPNDDVPRYDVTIPFIRMIAGPMDYTPGGMRNANKWNFRPVHSNPMTQGTRAHQVAMYVVFEAPLQMLADNPTIYRKEQETTTFISGIPTVFDETVALDGKVGEYVAIARKKDKTWYIGAMTNWDGREIDIDFSFLGDGNFEAEIFRDGINADREATDYVREVVPVNKNSKIKVKMSSGGGWAAVVR